MLHCAQFNIGQCLHQGRSHTRWLLMDMVLGSSRWRGSVHIAQIGTVLVFAVLLIAAAASLSRRASHCPKCSLSSSSSFCTQTNTCKCDHGGHSQIDTHSLLLTPCCCCWIALLPATVGRSTWNPTVVSVCLCTCTSERYRDSSRLVVPTPSRTDLAHCEQCHWRLHRHKAYVAAHRSALFADCHFLSLSSFLGYVVSVDDTKTEQLNRETGVCVCARSL